MAATRPPGPRGPAWVNFGRYLSDPLGMMSSLREDYGPVAFVRFPGRHSFHFVYGEAEAEAQAPAQGDRDAGIHNDFTRSANPFLAFAARATDSMAIAATAAP